MVGAAATSCVMREQLRFGNRFDHFINDPSDMMGRDKHFEIQNHLSLLVVVGFEGGRKLTFPYRLLLYFIWKKGWLHDILFSSSR